MSIARSQGIGILLHTGKVLVMAGTPTTQTTAELYDPATGTWTPTASLGDPKRSAFAAVLLRDGRVLVAGGTATGAETATCLLYDPASGSWSAAGSMGVARSEFTLTLLSDGRVLATGGESPLLTFLDSAETWDPATNSWSPTGSLSAAKGRHTATLLRDGRVMVTGGRISSGVTSAITEVWNPGSGTWTRVGDLLTARSWHAATLLPDGKVLAAGGGLVTGVEVFDPGSGTWSATSPLAQARTSFSMTLLPSGRVLVAGGSVAGSASVTTLFYDPGTGNWSAGPNMNTARWHHSSTMLPDGRVLVAGSNSPGTATAELFDGDSPSWTATGSLAVARSAPTATLLKSGKVLVAGGGGVLNTAEVYDPGTGTFSPTANSLADGRAAHTATALVTGRVLIAGGTGITSGSAELYDPLSNSFVGTGPMAGIRYSHTATLLPCGEVLVAGGEYGSPLPSAERYNPRTGKWRPTGSLNQARWRHTATLLADGRVLVTGGFGGGPRATAEIYDPATESWTLTAGSMAVGRTRHAATLLPNGKVLVTGGVSANTTAQLFDPATGLFSNTGSTAFIHDFLPTLTLLPNGRVLLAGDQLNLRKAEVYDPVTGSWTTLPDTLADRWLQAAVLLVDGRVLLAGGSGSTSAELLDVGRGELAGWRPQLFTASDPLVTGAPLTLAGSAFQGLGEGTSGLGYMHSATNYPLVQLRRLDNDRVEWLPVDPGTGWSNTALRSRPVTGAVPGLAIATVFTNGIPGRSLGLSVECPAPSITMQPLDQTVCVGGSASFSIAATADCPVYQWRKNLANLSDGGALTGTATPSLAINPVGIGDSGSYDVTVALSCSSTIATSAAATLTVHPPIGAVDASIAGPANVCTTCLGGIASEAHTGGGAVTHQWGFRTTSGGAITNIPGATSPSYQLSGADFPGPGNYFLVVQVSPDCGPLTISDEVPVTVANGAGAPNEVSYLTVTSRSGKNVLQWVYPAGFSSVRIRFNTGEPCVFPNDATSSGTFLTDEPGTGGAPGAYAHTGAVNGTTYCYTVFVDLGGGVSWSAGRTGSGHPFTTAGPVKWAFQTGLFSTTAPTVGTAAVIATNNGNVVHAMGRGPSGGEWPSGWKPVPLGGAVQNRSPVVPILVGGSNPVVFMGAQDGFVYAVDGSTGGSAAAPWAGGPAALGGRVQAAPAGLFTAYGGAFNYLLVGTREGSADNAFKALDPADGSVLATFDNGGGSSGIGIISGMAAVDMLANPDRVYFTSHARVGGSPNTLWCLELKAAPGVFNLLWARDDLGDIESSPVLRGGRVLVGTLKNGGTLYSIDAATGSSALDRTFLHGDGPVKGFVFPDRASPTNDAYFATNTKVWGVSETGAALVNKYAGGIPLPGAASPSIALFHTGSHYVYVGGGNGGLYQIDTNLPAPVAELAFVLGASPLTVGAPSLDTAYGLVHVGTEAGTFFAIEMPALAGASACVTDCAFRPFGQPCTTTLPPCTQTCDGAGACVP